MTIGILLVDKHSELAYGDPFACRLLGCSDETNLRKSWHRIRSNLGLLDSALPGDPENARTFNAGVDHSQALQVSMSPVRNPSFDGYVVHLKDSSASEVLSLQLLVASQVRNQNYLNSALIHDLRAPLHAMEIHLELLAENIADQPPARTLPPELRQQQSLQGVEILKEELGRLNRTLKTLLGTGQPLTMTFSQFDLMQALHELVVLLTPKARQQQVAVSLDGPCNRLMVDGNRDHLKQAFLNIAVNALEAMPQGGRLEVSANLVRDQVEVVFRDQGPGIAEEFLDQIYNLHFTTKTEGSGMGLFATQLVVADGHGGSVEVVNDRGGGVQVRCRLPRHRRIANKTRRH